MRMPFVPSRPRFFVAVCALLATTSLFAACDDAGGSPRAPQSDPLTYEDNLPVVMSVRAVCRLASDTPGAAAALITGADGSQSAVAGGRQYWFFGDTIRTEGDRQDVIPAAVATTTDTDPRDCLDLQFKTAAGSVTPMFPRLEETTAWPDGVLALDDGSMLFYMVKAIRTSPFAWHVGAIGLGRIPAGSVDGERLVEAIWDESTDFGAGIAGVRSPVRIGADIIVYISREDGLNYAARAPLARIGEASAYTYWDGDAWSPDPGDAEPMWQDPPDPYGFPADNGVQVSFDERIGKWIALYNSQMAATEVRIADEPWGPWSAPIRWFDCRPLVLERYPYCYTGELHRQLTRDDGDTVYVTISSQEPYDVTLLELRMASAIHDWRDNTTGVVRYAASSPGDGYEDRGVKFYASTTPIPGVAPIFERADGAGFVYTVEQPSDDAQPAFYAYRDAAGGPVETVAVTGNDARLVVGGDGDALFYVPCARRSCEESPSTP